MNKQLLAGWSMVVIAILFIGIYKLVFSYSMQFKHRYLVYIGLCILLVGLQIWLGREAVKYIINNL